MFLESDHHHWRNRRDAHFAVAEPALLADGRPGVHLRLGRALTVLSKDELAALFTRLADAVDVAEKETER